MKRLYIMRHCEPKPGHPMDGTRPLTSEGRRQAKEVAGWLKSYVGRVDICISSPFARALQTAEIVAPELGCHIVTTRMIEPDVKIQEMWDDIVRLAAMAQDVLVVGHDPSINNLLGWLCGWRPETIFDPPLKDWAPKYTGIRFAHGAVAHLKMMGDKDARLHWLITVPIVEKDEAFAEVEEAARALAETLL